MGIERVTDQLGGARENRFWGESTQAPGMHSKEQGFLMVARKL